MIAQDPVKMGPARTSTDGKGVTLRSQEYGPPRHDYQPEGTGQKDEGQDFASGDNSAQGDPADANVPSAKSVSDDWRLGREWAHGKVVRNR
jgi:hypothetical protein